MKKCAVTKDIANLAAKLYVKELCYSVNNKNKLASKTRPHQDLCFTIFASKIILLANSKYMMSFIDSKIQNTE